MNETPLVLSETNQKEINSKDLFDAFAKAQAKFPSIPKDTEVQVRNKEGKFLYSYKYADLTTIIDCVRPALTENGLSFTQDYFEHFKLGSGVATVIMHNSGQSIKTGFVPCAIGGLNMKDVAAQFTYAKRISLTAALGISADEDQDAASIEGRLGNQTAKQPQAKSKPVNHAPKPEPKYDSEPVPYYDDHTDYAPPPDYELGPSAAQIKRLFAIATKQGWSKDSIVDVLKVKFNKDSSKNLSMTEYEALVKYLENHTP